MLLSTLEAGGKQKGGQRMEQLPVKIKGGNCVSKCENYGVFVFFLMFICVFLQKQYIIGVSANFGH